jgi:peptidoglycan hydrolase-like protein with peptidoglycan-binding domain
VPHIRLPALVALCACAAAFALPATASAYRFGERTLKPGTSGKDVKTAQKLLRKLGEPIGVDGHYGPATTRAVRSFERDQGLRRNGRLEVEEAPTLKAAAAEAARERAGARRTTPVADGDAGGGLPPATDETAPAEGGATPTIGGATPADPVGVPGEKAVLNPDGTATAPASAPPEVHAIIAAGNEIATKPYKYGGGHGRWKDSGYDCSGSVSYALHGAGLLDSAMPSSGFMRWGERGEGEWVTIYANGGHMYMVVAGLRFDTSGAKPSRWQTKMRSSSGFTVRHPPGL